MCGAIQNRTRAIFSAHFHRQFIEFKSGGRQHFLHLLFLRPCGGSGKQWQQQIQIAACHGHKKLVFS